MTVRTAAELRTLLPRLIEDNTNKRISPMDVRDIIGDVIDSYTDGDTTLVQATNNLDAALRLLIGGKQDSLPAYNQVTTQALLSRAGNLFWQTLNLVPNGPGTQSGIGRALLITGTGDRDYAWRELPGGTAGADTTARAAAQAAQNTADTNTRSIAALSERSDSLQRQTDELVRKAADLDIVSDGLGWAAATSDEAGFTLFAQGTTVGDGLIDGDRDLMAADLSGVSWMQTTPVGATPQAVIVRVEGTLGPVDFALRVGDIINQLHDFRKVLSDDMWDYYYLGSVSNETIRVDRRAEVEHTRYHGELAGRALGPSDAAKAIAERAETKADDAQLDTDTVIEVTPDFTVGETAARNINISISHPRNAYSQANTVAVRVQGGAPTLVTYNPGMIRQVVQAEISATIFNNIGTMLTDGNFISLDIRLQIGNALFPPGHAQAGETNPDAIFFIRNVEVPVNAAPTAAVDQDARNAAAAASRAASAARTIADGKADPADIPENIPDAPANDASAAKRYELNVPQTTGAPTWVEAAAAAGGGSLEPIQIAHLLGLELEPESVAGTVAGLTRTFQLHVDYPAAFGTGQVDVWYEVFVDTVRIVNRTRWSSTAEDINVPIAALQAQNLLRAHAAAGFVEVHVDFYSQESGGVRFSRRDLVLSLVAESVPSPPDNDASAAKDYVLSVPQARGAATWKEDVPGLGPPEMFSGRRTFAHNSFRSTSQSATQVATITIDNLSPGDTILIWGRARVVGTRFSSGVSVTGNAYVSLSDTSQGTSTDGDGFFGSAPRRSTSSANSSTQTTAYRGDPGEFYHHMSDSTTSRTFYLWIDWLAQTTRSSFADGRIEADFWFTRIN